MRSIQLFAVLLTLGFYSTPAQCQTGNKAPVEPFVHTKYEYSDPAGKKLIIKNSLPKSGGNYIDPHGVKYLYAVFWTRIVNETATPVEITIDFPKKPFELSPLGGIYMNLLIPNTTVTPYKLPLYDYGLDVKHFLDNGGRAFTSLKRTIAPNDSIAFYVVPLSNKGVEGTLRTGSSIKGSNLLYTIK